MITTAAPKTTTRTLAEKAIEACRTIATFTETPGTITRTFLSPPVHDVHNFLRGWMDQLGMKSHVDAVGNLRGIYRCPRKNAPRLLIGSHIDTVPNSGAFDGVLGVVIAIALIEGLEDHSLSYDLEVVAFSEEEGVRFALPFIGSRALIGGIDNNLLQQSDANGITIAKAIENFGLDPAQIPEASADQKTFAYIEFHIEQGPVLEDLAISLGIVDAIVGQSRFEVTFRGKANHAGTTPMHLRHDSLAAAAEWITAVERTAQTTAGLVATVGRIAAWPGAANVVPGQVRTSLDIRHQLDATRSAAVTDLLTIGSEIAARRGLTFAAVRQMDEPATPMNVQLASALESACVATGVRPHRMASGAGHDALVIARKIPSAMLFLRSPGGISHHPDETVLIEDVQAALDAGLYFLKHLNAAAQLS